ncbi:hypothetical protein ACFQJ7_15180 [Halovenus rubra]|uniref:Uncharacterized protein n=2 Tax=Halovenus rubra TaxID=869890 RepID=A0ACC7E297_9EURY|nr:hypothetical protein [Halovenus rubra]
MELVDPYGDSETTHRVVTRLNPRKDWDEVGQIRVENRVVEVVMGYGDRVHVRLSAETEELDRIKQRLARAEEGTQLFQTSGPEYYATLLEDRDLVRSLLAVDPDDSDAWIDRMFNVEEFAVVDGEVWRYWSVPHHSHCRRVNTAGRDPLYDALVAELAGVPGSALVPAEGLASWGVKSHRYELAWDALRRHETDSERVRRFELTRLRRVSTVSDRPVLSCDWESSSSASWLDRLARWVLRSESADPPPRVPFPDSETMGSVLDGLRTLKHDLGYEFTIEGRTSRDDRS